MTNFNVDKLLSELGATLESNVKNIFEEHKSMFAKVGVNTVVEMFRSVIDRDQGELNAKAYYLFLQDLSDEEFLLLKKETNKKAYAWLEVDRKRRALVEQLLDVSKLAAQTVVKYLIMMA